MKRSMLSLVVVTAALLVGLVAASRAMSGAVQADPRAMAAANQLAQAGHYAEATAIYRQMLEQGIDDPALHYNLGNVAMLQEDPAAALAHYRQAAELAPRDADLRHNLTLASTAAGESERTGGPLALAAAATRSVLTINELALLTLGVWFLLGFLVLLYRHFLPDQRPRALRYLLAGGLTLTMVCGVALFSRLALA